ncbi:MAG: pilus assembly protein [Coriobacteriia bacterium]|nr:pilus assembly protein [Coriobacteriia bacterium]MCL2750273.1 pilus assembly protein [Coriobacteriia bacterium]
MKCHSNNKGQTTVEAAYLIPILMLLILMLVQPMILLYNRMVMENAAAEGCRLLVTATSIGNYSDEKYEGYIERRLAAIPPVDIFHVHGSGCTWVITLEGNELTSEVSVTIENQVKLLPLIGWGASLLGLTNANNNFEQKVTVTMPTQPNWVVANDPTGWVHAYE